MLRAISFDHQPLPATGEVHDKRSYRMLPAELISAQVAASQEFPEQTLGIGGMFAKVAGEVASLEDPALGRLLDFAGEVGLLAIIHCDIDVPFAKEGAPPAYLEDIKAVFKSHPKTTIIWAHT